MSIEAMKMALVALENIGCWLTTIGQKGLRDYEADAMEALRQAIEQAEKQEPFIYVREDNEKPFGGYEHCSEADAGAFPVYTAPVHAVNMKQERVDETAKGEHEPVAWITDGGKGELWWYRSSKFDEEGNLLGYNPDDVPLYTAPPRRKWVGLTDADKQEAFDETQEASGGFWEFAEYLEAKLKEKNTGA